MIRVYLDHNIIQGVKHQSKDVFKNIEYTLNQNKGKILVPYSPAHLSDLSRSQDGTEKSRKYLIQDLSLLSEITDNHCLIQEIDGHCASPNVLDPIDYFYSNFKQQKNDKLFEFEELFSFDTEAGGFFTNYLKTLENIPSGFPSEVFTGVDKYKGIDSKGWFARSRDDDSLLNVLKDIHDLMNKGNDNLYMTSREIVKQEYKLRSDDKAWSNPIKYLESKILESSGKNLREYVIDLVEKTIKNGREPSKLDYFNTHYLLLDQYGFKSDKKYNNMMDDMSHSYYGAHCDVFVSDDRKTLAKAKALYQHFKLSTRVCSPEQFDVVLESLIPNQFEILKPTEYLRNIATKGFVLMESIDDEGNPARVCKIDKPFFNHFNRLQITNELNDIVRIDLYKKSDTFFENSLFWTEIDAVISQLVNEYGVDGNGEALLNGDTEREEIVSGKWKGRVWNFGGKVELVMKIHKAPFGLTLSYSIL